MAYNTPAMEPRFQYTQTKALECAIAMQWAFAIWNAGRGGSRTAPAPEPIHVRIGLNAGEPIAEENDRPASSH